MSENIGQGRLNFFLEYFGAQYLHQLQPKKNLKSAQIKNLK